MGDIDTRERILAEATALFARDGYDGTSIQAVADAVGIRKQSLLHHFRSKQQLRDAVLDGLLNRWKDELPGILLSATSGEDMFRAAVTELLRFFRENPDRARLAAREAIDRPDHLKALLREHLWPWIGMVTDYIGKGKVRGNVREDVDPEAYCDLVMVLAVGSVAMGTVADGVFPDRTEGEAASSRDAELVRIAHDSLFTDREDS